MSEQDDIHAHKARYADAAGRVQTAIGALSTHPLLTPKHMRVGIDMGKSDHGGLVKLLIDKGIFTEAEFHKAMADQAELEASDYETMLNEFFGANISLI